MEFWGEVGLHGKIGDISSAEITDLCNLHSTLYFNLLS